MIVRRTLRALARLARTCTGAAALGALALLAAPSCTVFNGLVAEQDAGVGGGGTTPWVAPELSYLELEDAARLCRWVLECDRLADSIVASIGVPADARNFSQCLHWAAGPLPPGHPGLSEQRALLQALSGVTSCEEALATTYLEVIVPGKDPRCDDVVERACDGDLALDCSDLELGTISRCSSPRFSPGDHYCLAGYCVHGDCEPAPEITYECTDEVGYICAASSEAGLACAPLGLTCAFGKTCGTSTSSAPTCNALGETSCSTENADVVRVCTGLLVTEFHCDKLPAGTCAVTGAARCGFASDVCTPVDDGQNVCNGSVLAACVAGQRIAFDCASIGLSCQSSAGEKSGRCAAP